jgi:hypothetical protein
MLIRIRNSKSIKIITITVILSFLTEIINPLQLFALTGGPSQPEMAGFTPVNTENLVDVFSGDFKYTVPIMTVPGPNGGFPINLNYNANIGMEYEASWVGLGWNLNPGAINREVRGLPDDFKGDKITKKYLRKDNKTYIFTPGNSVEIAGANFGIGISTSKSLIYNTYAGLTLTKSFGISPTLYRKSDQAGEGSIPFGSVGYNQTQSSSEGTSRSFSIKRDNRHVSYGLTYGYNSKSGTHSFSTQISPKVSKDYYRTVNDRIANNVSKTSINSSNIGCSFSTAAILPPLNLPITSTTFTTSFQAGFSAAFVEPGKSIMASVCVQKTESDPIENKSYGLLYSDMADDHSLMDFNREKEILINKNSKNLPLPVLTYDVYSINGEQMGGSFRAYRSDYGHFKDNKIVTTSSTAEAGADLGFGTGVQLGVNGSFTYGENTTSDWDENSYCTSFKYYNKESYKNSSNRNISPILFEPFYFKMMGEQTASSTNVIDEIGGENSVRFPLSKKFSVTPWGSLKHDYYTTSKLGTQTVNYYTQNERTKRTTSIEYKTGIEGNGRQKHHIAEISVVNSNGERFTYGKTLYNQCEREVTFSIPHQTEPDGSSLDTSSTTNNYSDGNASGTVRVGKEKLYSKTETPPYAYSYLITSITSPDYVDITNDGPSDDDLGYWVKFSYTDVYSGSNLYKWRFPYYGANFFMGDQSNQNDDKGSFTYGEKEISYVNRIETKTHFALFYTSPRNDSREVANDLHGGIGQYSLYKLDSIKLYSKADPTIPIKTAVFDYDYSLCQKVFNNIYFDSQTIINGKLTLKSVYFKYANSVKGTENPYVFTYSDQNPNYNPTLMDRWGNYKGNANYFEHYVTQDKIEADKWARAWLLKKIDLPSGGSIEVEYESDDYGYVQNKKPMYMATINSHTNFYPDNEGKYYVYFNKDPNINATEYVSGFQNNLMFFKIATKFEPELEADYIQGYIKIIPSTASNYGDGSIGKVEVEPFEILPCHPIYYFCCQYLKNNRPDLLFNENNSSENLNDITGFFSSLFSSGFFATAMAMNSQSDYFYYCSTKNYYTSISILNKMPSYVRLNDPNKNKIGGGARVKKLTVNDNWTKSAPASYTQEYFYKKMENGKLISSGVVENEPVVCAEENSLRNPVIDNEKGLFFIEDELYSENPYGESYFPGANVGYSQVTVKTLTPTNVNLSGSGIQVYEFYTAKDFPIFVSQTPIQITTNPTPNILELITVGFKQETSNAFSQGYSIELNDMHGKQKSLTTYPYIPLTNISELLDALSTSGYTSRVEYKYKSIFKNDINKVDNKVPVLTSDGYQTTAFLGQTYDFIIDQRQNVTKSDGGGANAQFMLGFYYPPSPLASVMPSVDCFEETIRSVATCKVIYKSGILEKTIAYNNGSKITTENLAWDPYTGAVLMSKTSNEFEQPIYNYSLPLYWYNKNLGSIAQNYRAIYYNNQTPENVFNTFDRVQITNSVYPIKEINTSSNLCRYWDNTDTPHDALINNSEILKSRFSNQVNIMGSNIVSLKNPISDRRYPFIETFNSDIMNLINHKCCYAYQDCNGNERYIRIEFDIDSNKLFFISLPSLNSDFCRAPLIKVLDNPYVVSPILETTLDCDTFKFSIKNGVFTIYCDGNFEKQFLWNDEKKIFSTCIDGVLNASSVDLVNKWTYDYQDANLSVSNPNYLGIPNVYKPKRSSVYVTSRNQTGNGSDYQTNIAYDGTYSSFAMYSNINGNADNLQDPWTWNSEITKYSPFNFEIENRNALNIYSSALYGYKNSIPTAVANNARYYEIGYDGFENDHNILIGQNRNHINCISGQISSNYAHTGNFSLRNTSLSIRATVFHKDSVLVNSNNICLTKDKKYLFSCWVRSEDCRVIDNLGEQYQLTISGGVASNFKKYEKVECWQRIEFEFTPQTIGNITIKLTPTNGTQKMVYKYFDDIRITPFNSVFKSYVYDPGTYRLIADLDDNNFATFYNYDEEGILVQIKKETEKGIQTIKTTRQNLHK